MTFAELGLPGRLVAALAKQKIAEPMAIQEAALPVLLDEADRLPVADLHGAFQKSERKRAMDDFRAGRVRVLIASDVAARGLDIPGVSHILNLDAPTESKAYLHRVGRTARAGAHGQALTLLTTAEERVIRRYEKELGITMVPLLLRDGQVRPAQGYPG